MTIVAVGLLGSIYAIFGGLKAVAVSDTINGYGLLIGGLAIPLIALVSIGDGNPLSGLMKVYEHAPEKFNVIGAKDSVLPFEVLFTGLIINQLYFWSMNQTIIQRALGAKNLVEGQKGLIYAGFVKILGPIIVVLPGIIAYHIFGNELDVSQGDQSYGMLVAKVLPASLVGFFAAVLFGAILSSFNSALNSSVTLFGLDIYKQYFKKDATEKEVVKAGKTFGIGLALFSMLIAPTIANAPDGLFGYLQEVNGCYSIPILTIIIVGYLTKRVPAVAAKVAMLSGVVLYCFSQFYLKGEVEAAGGTYPHYLHVMAILFSFNVLLMLAIGYFKPRTEEFELEYTKQVDITPWKLVKPMGIVIASIVILIYIAFA
jgi:SSS family solute:Na+ symporter